MTNKALYSAAATAADGRMMGQMADERREVPIVALPQLTPSPPNTTPSVFPYAIRRLALSCWIISISLQILARIKYESCAVQYFKNLESHFIHFILSIHFVRSGKQRLLM